MVIFGLEGHSRHSIWGAGCNSCKLWMAHDDTYPWCPNVTIVGNHAIRNTVFESFTSRLMANKVTFSGFHDTIYRSYLSNGCVLEPPPVSVLIKGFFFYNESLLEVYTMRCPKCQDRPKILICDGIYLTIAKDKLLQPEDETLEANSCWYGGPPCRDVPLHFLDSRVLGNESDEEEYMTGEDNGTDLDIHTDTDSSLEMAVTPSKRPKLSPKSQKSPSKCNKWYSKRTRRSGGIFCIFCPHAVSYGCHLMLTPEGRKDLFWAISRYFEHLPEHIIYDFSCSAETFCKSRSELVGGIWNDVSFWIDVFHSANHTCSRRFHLSSAQKGDLNLVRSELAEMANGRLVNLKTSCKYMGHRNCFMFTKIFLNDWNMRQIYKGERKYF